MGQPIADKRAEGGRQAQSGRTEPREQGQTERTEARSNAAQNMNNDWDHHHDYDDDDDWGWAVAGVAGGARVGVRCRGPPTPPHLSGAPRSPTAVRAGGGSKYRGAGSGYHQK